MSNNIAFFKQKFNALESVLQDKYAELWDMTSELEHFYKRNKSKCKDFKLKRKFLNKGSKYRFIETEELIFISDQYDFLVKYEIYYDEPDSYNDSPIKESYFSLMSKTDDFLSLDNEKLKSLKAFLKTKLRKVKISKII